MPFVDIYEFQLLSADAEIGEVLVETQGDLSLFTFLKIGEPTAAVKKKKEATVQDACERLHKNHLTGNDKFQVKQIDFERVVDYIMKTFSWHEKTSLKLEGFA